MSYANDKQSYDLVTENYTTFDPSLLAGYEIVFNREINLYFSYFDSDDKGKGNETEEEKRIVRFRILEKREDSLEEIRMEIFSEADITFMLESVITTQSFRDLSAKNRLRIKFEDFSRSVIDLLEKSVTAPDDCQIRYLQNEDYSGRLVFMQTLRLRKLEVFSIDFVLSQDDLVRNQAQYRFNRLKMELDQKSEEYKQQMQRLEAKNPSFAKQIRKSVEFSVQQRIIQEAPDTH